jgi:hypothetical protein
MNAVITARSPDKYMNVITKVASFEIAKKVRVSQGYILLGVKLKVIILISGIIEVSACLH